MIRQATVEEVEQFCETAHPEFQGEFVKYVIAAATDTSFWVIDQGGEFVGMLVSAELPAEAATPAGWWLAYSWVRPDARDNHRAWEMASAGIDLLVADGHTFTRGTCGCNKRCTPFVCTYPNSDPEQYRALEGLGFAQIERPFRLLNDSDIRGAVFFDCHSIDPTWEP